MSQAGLTVVRVSSIYRTEPQGDAEQPWFFNQVAELATCLQPQDLLRVLQKIEADMGRERNARRYGPRVIDLDILLYDQMEVRDENLVIPHARMHERAFMLVPLLEIAADACLPDGTAVKDLLSGLKFSLTDDKIWQTL